MATEPTQERSRNRRDDLLGAAIELLAEGGTRAITHRAVAARAGVPLASTTYYFESIDDLTTQALARHVGDRVAELEQLVLAATEAGSSLADISERLAESLADRAGDVVIAQFEVYLEAWRNQDLRQPVAAALDAFEAMAGAALSALGVADPATHAPAFVAAVDGFALHRLARPRPRDEEIAVLTATLRALFIAAVMDDQEHDHWDERLGALPPGAPGF